MKHLDGKITSSPLNVPFHHLKSNSSPTLARKRWNNWLQQQNISIPIFIPVYTNYDSILMRFISAAIKGADTNPCMHEMSSCQQNAPFLLQWFLFFPTLCQSVTVISSMLIKANYTETGRHN